MSNRDERGQCDDGDERREGAIRSKRVKRSARVRDEPERRSPQNALQVVPLSWLAAPALVLMVGLLWLAFRSVRLEARLDAMTSPRAPSSGAGVPPSGTAVPAAPTVPAAAEPVAAPAPQPVQLTPINTASVLKMWALIQPRVRVHCADHEGAEPPAEIRMALVLDDKGGVQHLQAVEPSNRALADCVAAVTAQHQFPGAGEPTAGVVALPWKRGAAGRQPAAAGGR